MSDFYDRTAPLHHLIFQNWDESIERHAGQLAGIIRERWKDATTILDVSCGIGIRPLDLRMRALLLLPPIYPRER